ncbi:hypothetical protein FRC09_012973 [Ceratobasidium sp. 395]|nr:hypothetical protein FRC09_012973 [Ceratobasidium sp. 395]
MSPSLQELSVILSGSPALVTLRLRRMTTPFPVQALAVPLPKLQLLDIIDLDHTSSLGLLNALSPGGLELDFRFSLGRLTNRDVTEVIVPFCRRSNIASLYLSDTNHGPDVRVNSLLQCLPSIRVLVLDNEHNDFHAASMSNVNSGKNTACCPGLHTLCLKSSSGLNEDAQEQVEEILDIYSLRKIVLEGFELASYDGDSQDSDELAQWDERNADFLGNLNRKVQSVIVDKGLLDGEYEEVDPHIRKLINASKGASERT